MAREVLFSAVEGVTFVCRFSVSLRLPLSVLVCFPFVRVTGGLERIASLSTGIRVVKGLGCEFVGRGVRGLCLRSWIDIRRGIEDLEGEIEGSGGGAVGILVMEVGGSWFTTGLDGVYFRIVEFGSKDASADGVLRRASSSSVFTRPDDAAVVVDVVA